MLSRRFLLAVAISGIAAGTLSTLAQVGLWLALTDDFPAILWRDARSAVAIILGPGVLSSSTASMTSIMAMATLVHFALSLIYAGLFCLIARRLGWHAAVSVGALLGAVLYFINMYGFTLVFPWFAASRDPITFVAHVVFGASATWSGKLALNRLTAARSRQIRHAAHRPEA